MGFGTVVTHIILFVSIITVAAGFLITINQYVQGATNSINQQQERVSDRIQTDISIGSVAYENTTSPDTITVSATNSGDTTLDPKKTDVFLDELRVSRNDRTIAIQTDTETKNPDLWDPQEVVEIEFQQDIEPGVHAVKIVAPNGVSTEESFST